MNQKSLRVLEFNKIIELLKSKASSSLGLKYIEELVPSSDYEEVKYMQQETSETQSILTKRGYVGLQGIHDIEDKVKRAGVGASLDPGSLIMIADTLRAARTLRNSLSGSDEEDFNYPIIQSLSNGLYAYREIEDAIYNAILFNGMQIFIASYLVPKHGGFGETGFCIKSFGDVQEILISGGQFSRVGFSVFLLLYSCFAIWPIIKRNDSSSVIQK